MASMYWTCAAAGGVHQAQAGALYESQVVVCMDVGDPHKAQLGQGFCSPVGPQSQAELVQGGLSAVYERAAPLEQLHVVLHGRQGLAPAGPEPEAPC